MKYFDILTLTSAYIFKELSNEYSLWETLDKSVRISLNDTDILLTDEVEPHLNEFLNNIAEKETILFFVFMYNMENRL